MRIETTLNVHQDVLSQLIEASMMTMRSMSSIMAMVLHRITVDSRIMSRSFKRIQYQNRDRENNWKTVHVVVDSATYEYFLDMRKVFKMSVSLLLAIAVSKYLKDITNDLCNNKDTDNYLCRSYLISKKVIDGVPCFYIYWGIPGINHLKKLFYDG
jgi:predicted DsbA family dithiol-disulfide isomerase